MTNKAEEVKPRYLTIAIRYTDEKGVLQTNTDTKICVCETTDREWEKPARQWEVSLLARLATELTQMHQENHSGVLTFEQHQRYKQAAELMTAAWRKRGWIKPEDTAFQHLAVRDPFRAEMLVSNLRFRESRKKAIFNSPIQKSEFPQISSASKLVESNIEHQPSLIDGIIRQGEKMVVGGPSKARKTWLLMNLAVSVASGTDWIGFSTRKARLLFVNFELSEPTFKSRLTQIAKTKGLDPKTALDRLDVLHLRGFKADDPGVIIDKIIEQARFRKYGAIILDPTYKMLGSREENNAKDMNQLMSDYDRLSKTLNVAVVFVAHFPKGNMSKREAIDRISGSSVFARDPDSILIMSKLGKAEVKKAITARNKAEKAKEGEKWGGVGERAVTVLRLLESPAGHGAWQNACMIAIKGFSKSKFNTDIKRLIKAEFVDHGEDVYAITEKGAEFLKSLESIAADETSEEPQVDTKDAYRGVYRMDFIFRDNPPQNPIALRFGDWKSGDFIHHRAQITLDDAEDQEDEEDGKGGSNAVPVEVRTNGETITAVCTKCGHFAESFCETKAKPGNSLRRCLAILKEECPNGEKNFYQAA
jgi:hypothetical protein